MTKQELTRLRVRGYNDGLAGRPPAMRSDPVYMTSYRHGRDRALAIAAK